MSSDTLTIIIQIASLFLVLRRMDRMEERLIQRVDNIDY